MQHPTITNNNSYRHYNLPIIFPCMAFSGTNWILHDHSKPTMHFHNCVELGFCRSGSGIFFVENSEFSFREGDYSFIPENAAHGTVATPGNQSSWEYILFDPYLLFKNILPEPKLNELLLHLTNCFGVITEKNDKEIHFMMYCIFNELHKKESFHQDSLKGLFFSLLLLIARNKSNDALSKSDFQWLYSSLSYIRKNYHRKITIAEIANSCCHLSESHFRKKFTQTMHMGPLEYMNHLRIRIACQLIYNNEKSINEIASEVGFPTLSSFNRNFHALLGCSPSDWRKQQTVCNIIPEITSIEEQTVQQLFIP